MTEPKFQRFSGFHRVLHWLIAVPYIALLVSGALMLLHHLGWIDSRPESVLVKLHRWTGLVFAGLVLQLLLTALAAGHWKAVGRDFLDWLKFRARDLLWLIVIPLNAFFPKWFHLPAVGRFNAGQKLHGLFILIAVIGFIATGLIMILVPGWLTVWRIHVILFFGATAFLCVHLFLGLINPPTRRALYGIFTGNVSRRYIREHHAMVLKEPPQDTAPHAIVSIKALIMTALIVAVPLWIWWLQRGYSLDRSALFAPTMIGMISPGPLASVHASLIREDNCVACHTNSGPVTDSSCLACHAEISKALAQRIGYHGTLDGDCVSCHTEHHGSGADLRNLDPHTFNHNLAQFPLNGSHRLLNCDQCHVQHSPTPGQTRFIGLSFSSCTACHSNPHADMPGADCARCHTEQGWTGTNLVFNHNRDSQFKLDAIHSSLNCASCHQQTATVAVFRGTPSSCANCHAPVAEAMAGKMGSLALKPDPHNARVSCIDCHTPGIRNQTPEQFATQCERCHGAPYRDLFFDWQKSLDDKEQSARLTLAQLSRANPPAAQHWSDVLDQAHAAGIHNIQGSMDTFEKIGK